MVVREMFSRALEPNTRARDEVLLSRLPATPTVVPGRLL